MQSNCIKFDLENGQPSPGNMEGMQHDPSESCTGNATHYNAIKWRAHPKEQEQFQMRKQSRQPKRKTKDESSNKKFQDLQKFIDKIDMQDIK